MSRLSFNSVLFSLLATGVSSFGAGCSHKQKVAQSPFPAAPPKSASIRRLLAPVAPESSPAVASKDPGGAAIFFDFDSALLRNEARPVLQKMALLLRGKDKEDLKVDGNCDELGTVEYNLALGDQRARAAKEYLVHLGVASNRIKAVSYGSQRPRSAGHDDDARARNRRDDFVLR
jgi:outer membrane protein OmpA-like peptidoglycan-associated protein